MPNNSACRRYFREACAEANKVGWKKFYLKELGSLRQFNPELYRFIDDIIVQFGYNKYDLDKVYIGIALLLKGLWPLPLVSDSVANAVKRDIYASEKRRELIYDDGDRYLRSVVREMYLEYRQYLDGICGQNTVFSDKMLILTWLIVVVIKRQLSVQSTSPEIRELCISLNIGLE